MRRKLTLGAMGILLVVASTSSSSGTVRSDSQHRRSEALHIVVKEVASSYLDLGEQGFGQSDQLVFTNNLFRAGRKVGEDGGSCTVTRLTGAGANTWLCVASNSLPGGQITVEGIVTYAPGEELKAKPYYLAITGGTGRYRGARGQVKIEEVSGVEIHATFLISRR